MCMCDRTLFAGLSTAVPGIEPEQPDTKHTEEARGDPVKAKTDTETPPTLKTSEELAMDKRFFRGMVPEEGD